MIPFLIGFVLAVLIAAAAYRRGSLSASGALGAVLVGTITFALGGWGGGALLVLFFVSSSGLSHYREGFKEQLGDKFSKGHRRDIWQTLANGGAGAACLLGNALAPSPLWWAGFVGAIATVNADTWATELGVLARNRPILLTTGKAVEPGTSGAITATGTLAALAGSALIALVGGIATWQSGLAAALAIGLGGALSGVFGSLFDSLMGATVQAIYYVDALGKETEQHPVHRSGHPTRHIRGWAWLNNDLVNFIASVAGAALAAVLYGALV